jgi:hypothetical protein
LDYAISAKRVWGGGLNAEEISILNQEMFAIGAKGPLLSFGIWMLAPVLLEYGTENKKKSTSQNYKRRDQMVSGIF